MDHALTMSRANLMGFEVELNTAFDHLGYPGIKLPSLHAAFGKHIAYVRDEKRCMIMSLPNRCDHYTRVDMPFRWKLPETHQIIKWGTVILMLGALLVWWRPLIDLLGLVGDQEAIIAYFERSGPTALVVLFILLFLQVFLAPIPGHAFMVAAGYVYGFWISVLLTLASTAIATQLAFILTRRYGLPVVQRLASEKFIDRWNKIAGNRGGVFFFFAFILPIFPSDFMCFVAGLGKISHRDFFFANFLGRLFIASVLCSIGSHGISNPIEFAIFIIVLYGFLFLTWKPIIKFLGDRAASRRVGQER